MYQYHFSKGLSYKADFDPKVSTSVLVDYENFCASLAGQVKEPNLDDFLDSFVRDLEDRVVLHSYAFFADFQKLPDEQEQALRRRFPNNCIFQCDSVRYVNKNKEYTDFYLLNDLYCKVAFLKQSPQYVIFSGDGHFADSIKTMRAYSKVVFGCYALASSFSKGLKDAVDWAVEIKIDVPEEQRPGFFSRGLSQQEELWIAQIQYVDQNLPYDCSYNITLQYLKGHYPYLDGFEEALDTLVEKHRVSKMKNPRYEDYILQLLDTYEN